MNRLFCLSANRVLLAVALLATCAWVWPAWSPAHAQQQPPPGTLYALTASNNLISFNTLTPGTIIRSVAVTGLASGETLTGLDFRPANNRL